MDVDTTNKEQDLEAFNAVMALSELDICKHLSVIEELSSYEQFNSIRVNVPDGDDYNFDPLTNNDQCVSLMLKHNVERKWEEYDFIGWAYHVVNGNNKMHITERQDFDGTGEPDISMQKAICLAVILNKSEAFKLNSR